MYFSYSPQRSCNTRIDYRFEVSKNRIRITYRTGREVTGKVDGIYDVYFKEDGCEEYILSLDLESFDFSEWPFSPLTEFKTIDGERYIKLLKPYGPEEENNLAITYPGWNKIDGDCVESGIVLKTSLSEFQKLVLLWKSQLSEIKCQIYNLLLYLSEEYKKTHSEAAPFPSPISIRALKTSIFQNTILYIEAVANFLSAMTVCINNEIDGSPVKATCLEQGDIDKLTEANGKYIKLEDKLVFSVECLNRLLAGGVKVNKGDCNWGRFKDFKKRRDSIVHVKNHGNSGYRALTLDCMVASVKITDIDMARSMELLCWFNVLLDDVIRLVGGEGRLGYHGFNDYIIRASVKLSFALADIPSEKTLQKYNVDYLRQ